MKISYFLPVTLGCIITLFAGCGKEEAGTWGNFKPLNEIDKHIASYYDASLGQAANPKSGNPAVYVDFSDGLIQAYTANALNGQIVEAICHKLLSPNIEWNSMGGSEITPLTITSTELFNKVTDATQYIQIMAPIEGALKKITSSSNDALLITDFEEYTKDANGNGLEQFENYQKDYFVEWIKKGNSITFFYNNYSETNKKSKITTVKNLYFTVFTHGKADETSLVTMIKDALKGRFSPKIFELNNTPYSVTNNYGGKENTGIANQTFAKWVNYNFNASVDKNLPYEVIGISKPWNEDLEKYVQNIIQKEKGLFMNKLTLNAKDQSCFKLEKIAVKVYDVSDDYEKYARCNEAKSHIPVLTKNEKKDDIWDEKSKKDPVIKECYATNNIAIKPEWVYSPTDLTTNELPEVFDFDKEIYAGHLKNDPEKISLNTVFHSNYKFKNIKSGSALLRIDYIIDDVTFNDANTQLNDFKWISITEKTSGGKEKPNTSLSEAIRNTLQDRSISPKGKVIYSYYIKFANSNKSEK